MWDKVTGNDMSKQQKVFKKRVQKLPQDYQNAWQELNRKIWRYSNLTGRNLYPILSGILDLFEESASEKIPVSAVTGDKMDEFIAEIAQVEGAQTTRDRLRQQLNENVKKKLRR